MCVATPTKLRLLCIQEGITCGQRLQPRVPRSKSIAILDELLNFCLTYMTTSLHTKGTTLLVMAIKVLELRVASKNKDWDCCALPSLLQMCSNKTCIKFRHVSRVVCSWASGAILCLAQNSSTPSEHRCLTSLVQELSPPRTIEIFSNYECHCDVSIRCGSS